MNPVTLKILNDSGCTSYLVGCRATGAALLVDPKVGRAAVYRKALADYGLTLAGTFDTHTHADHLSDSVSYIRQGLPLAMGARTACQRPHRALREGDAVTVGQLSFRVVELPGHTPDSVALFGHGLVLTGDTLLVGGLARADFRGSDAAQLFESVQRKLLVLPDATVVLPGHGYQDLLFSTIGHEKARNPALRHPDGRAYAASLALVEGAGNTPDVDATLATNLAAEPELPDAPTAVAACCSMGSAAIAGPKIREQTCEELALRRAEIAAQKGWIDVRDPWEWKQAHIPGVPNFPLSELGFHLDEIRQRGTKPTPMVVSCKSGARSMTAAKTLTYLGVLDDPISMAGGFGRWEQLGLPTEK